MKLLIIPSGGMGLDGITMSIMNYYHYFNKSNISTTFVATKIKCEKKYFDSISKEIENNGDRVILLERRKNILRYLFQLIKLMKKDNYDIIHVHGSSSLLAIELLAAKICGIKVRIAHSHNTTCNYRILNIVLKYIFNYLTTCRLACGRDAGKWLFGNKDFKVLKNGIEADDFKYNKEIRDKIRINLNLEGKKVIGHVGAFNEQKNQSFLIDILKELLIIDKNYRLVFIGDGEKREEIERKALIAGIKDKVIFLGRRTDISDLLQAMDLMVLPSKYEGLPVVAIEWQASGLPIVVSDKVTSEIALTNLVTFKSLNDGASEWAITIDSLIKYERVSKIDVIREVGYDIKKNSDALVNLYNKLI